MSSFHLFSLFISAPLNHFVLLCFPFPGSHLSFPPVLFSFRIFAFIHIPSFMPLCSLCFCSCCFSILCREHSCNANYIDWRKGEGARKRVGEGGERPGRPLHACTQKHIFVLNKKWMESIDEGGGKEKKRGMMRSGENWEENEKLEESDCNSLLLSNPKEFTDSRGGEKKREWGREWLWSQERGR